MLVVPDQASPLRQALLAYDGSPKADEALFVAAYLAGQWQLPLVVVTVVDSLHPPAILDQARRYLTDQVVTATLSKGRAARRRS
jgi:hypothetical protein